ncbi:MAG TPA: oxidoreductase [Bacteroidetes bacterium]|nr:oxidoreductase [Bacteroidota bacterium]
MDKKYNVALASFGMSGRVFHGPLLKVHKGFKVRKVLERTRNLSADLFPRAEIVRTYEDILHDGEIDLVVVNTPDRLHYEMTRQALEAGKHVVVEKPVTLRAREADELIQLAREKERILTVFQNRRWDGDFLTVKKILKEGWLGRLVEMESHFDRYRNYLREESWKDRENEGTGSIYNLGSHLVDQALVLFGMPEALFADLRVVRSGSKVNDYFDIRLFYPGLRVILKNSYLVMKPGPRFMVHGEEGSYLKYGIDPQEERLTAGVLPLEPGWSAEEKKNWGYLVSNGKLPYDGKYQSVPGNYMAFYDHLYKTLQGEEPLAVRPEESRDVIRLIELAIESNEKKKVVEIA